MPNYRASVGHPPFIHVKRANPVTLAGQEISFSIGSSGGSPLFFDDFGYTVGRTDSGSSKTTAFTAAGWTGIFDETTNPTDSQGYISTASSIPGYAGSLPGGSGRVLRLECQPSPGNQGDIHLQLGNGNYGDIPANVWFQHWIYINRSGSELSSFNTIRNKWFYPLFGAQDGYPMASTETAWLLDMGNARFEGNTTYTSPVPGAMTFRNHADAPASGFRAYMTDQAGSGNYQQMTPRGLATENDHWLFPNTWYLVKYHMDVSQADGSHRIWWREYGQHATGFGNPRSQWIVGTTSGFSYTTYTLDRAGAMFLQFPVTVGPTNGTGDPYWIYIGDFAMADAEGDLPTYGSY